MCEGAAPETIVLKRFIHKRYRGELVSHAAKAAAELSTLNRAIDSAEEPSDKRCRTCPASMPQICGTLKRKLLENPTLYLKSSRQIAAGVKERVNDRCSRSRACISRSLSVSTVLADDCP
jgi:hypothetical protein